MANKMKIKYRKGVVSECGLYYIYNGTKYWYTPNQHDYIVITLHTIMRRFNIYNEFRGYMGSVDHYKETKGMMSQAKKLLVVNPNHYYRHNIESTIIQYEASMIEQQKKIYNYSKIFRFLYN